jgi:hypothetical protein
METKVQYNTQNRLFFFCTVCIFLYIYNGIGGPSDNAIPEEWQLFLLLFIVIFSLSI